MHPVRIRREPSRSLVGLPHKGPYIEIGRAYEKLGALMAARGLMGDVRGMIAVYYDRPEDKAPEDLRSHAAFAVPIGTKADAPLKLLPLPGGDHAVLRYQGPYAGLAGAYDQLFQQWLPNSGREPADGPVFELYHNTPADTPPEDLVTEICLPLK
tara:strand:- start:28 stop:492 length:465 start_codon:yes stop_codon:yes gene_type:complete